MYKVFISDKPLLFTDREPDHIDNQLVMDYDSPESLTGLVHELAHEEHLEEAVIFHDDLDELWEVFCSLFVQIEAAGGLVRNELGQLLFIFRRGKWDLPKGKLDQGESPKEAALREVQEECGLRELSIIADHGDTYHTYVLKKKGILKHTYWFDMFSNSKEELVPESEEDITEARWFNKDRLAEPLANTYASIRELVQ